MTIPVPVEANAKTRVEINDSCNDCCPKFCCFGRKVKHHKKRERSTEITINIDGPKQDTVTYQVMPAVTFKDKK